MKLTTSLLSWAGSTIKPDFVLGGGRFVTTPPKGMFFYTFPSVRVMILRHNSKTSEWLVPGFQRILPDPVGKMGTCRKRGWRKKKRFDKCPNPAEILRVYYYNFPLPH